MRIPLRLVPFTLLLASSAFALLNPGLAQPDPNLPQRPPEKPLPATPAVVYVSDFDLDVQHGNGTRTAPPRTPPPAPSGGASSSPSTAQKSIPLTPPSNTPALPRAANSQPEASPAERASVLVNAMSENLIVALEKAGYKARRLRTGAPRPAAGLLIRGVFAEADEKNRVRRLLIRGESAAPKMLLYVGVNNLARPEQPLYELAYAPDKDEKRGPVITITSYAPASRFELSGNPSGEELQKIASQIVADLTALLNVNRLSLPQ